LYIYGIIYFDNSNMCVEEEEGRKEGPLAMEMKERDEGKNT